MLRDAHAALHRERYEPDCKFCDELLQRAKQNHREHALTLDPDTMAWETPDHSDWECVQAYRRYAQKMSES